MITFDIRNLKGFTLFRLEQVDDHLESAFYFGSVRVTYSEWEKLNHVLVSGFIVNGERVEGLNGLKEFLREFDTNQH